MAVKVQYSPDGSSIQNPKSIVVRNAKLGLTRRARKSELKWFADRGFTEESQKSEVRDQQIETKKIN